jgi:hypothetical protein
VLCSCGQDARDPAGEDAGATTGKTRSMARLKPCPSKAKACCEPIPETVLCSCGQDARDTAGEDAGATTGKMRFMARLKPCPSNSYWPERPAPPRTTLGSEEDLLRSAEREKLLDNKR